jgi:putative inorganic carbon (hco3(-)) transporter
MRRPNPAAIFLARHIRLIQFLGVTACLPALILPDALPRPMLSGSLIGIGLMALLGIVVTRRPFLRTPLDIPMWLLGLVVCLNMLVSANPELTLPHVTKTLAGIAIAYAIVGLLSETRWFTIAGWAICLLGLLLVPLVLFGTNWPGSSKLSWISWMIERSPLRFRPFWKPADYRGFNVNLAGGTLAMLLPIPVAYALFARSHKKNIGSQAVSLIVRLAAGMDAILITGMLLSTQSRGAILAALTAVGIMLAARDWRWFIAVALVLAAGFIAVETGILPPPPTLNLASDAESALNSATGRLELYSRAIHIIGDFPLTGIGMGLVDEILPLRYPLFRSGPSAQPNHLHNLWLNAGAELGIPGLAGLLSFAIGLLTLTWKAARRTARNARPPRDTPLVLGTLGVIVVFCVHGLTDTVTYYLRAHLIAWALFGVALAVSMRDYDNETEGQGTGDQW